MYPVFLLICTFTCPNIVDASVVMSNGRMMASPPSLQQAGNVGPQSGTQPRAAQANVQRVMTDTQKIDAGRALFAKSCSVCHGQEGVGNRAPALRGARLTADYVKGVVAEGRPGTMMPAFKSAFSSSQVDQLAAYIGSLQVERSFWAGLRGNAAAGQRVFASGAKKHSCQECHSFKGKGGRVGPDLTTKLAGKTPREIFQKIVVVPHRSADPAYLTMALVTKGGERVVGIRANSNANEVQFYDTSSLPPTFRTFAQADVASITQLGGSAMPSDFASRLSLKQLLDLVAFLKSGADGVSASPTLEDVVTPSTR